MNTGTTMANTAMHPSTWSTGAAKAFVVAHPMGVAIVGGILVGAGTYYIVKKLFGGKQEATATA